MPISQYPQVTPPTIQIDCNYPGANARIVADTVAAPIEQQVNGVEDMLYMASQCTSDGSYTLTVTFKIGADLNMSQIRVLNRVALAYPQLPDVVNATGVTTRKRSAEILMTIMLSSPSGRYSQLYLSNYALIRLRDELSRLPGVSDVLLFGQRDYSMRIWLDPDKLAARSLTAGDVITALQQQNQPLVAGNLGQPPVAAGQPLQIPISGLGRLSTEEEFRNVIVKVGAQGQTVFLRDVAIVELGAKQEDITNTFDHKSAVGLAVFLLADANALEAHDRIVAKMDEMAKEFPVGIIYEIGYDTTPFIRESINEVFKSLWQSIALVAVVVLVFLQSWRAPLFRSRPCRSPSWGPSPRWRPWVTRSTTSRCSGWCWRSASWWMTPSWWWRRCSTSWRRDWRRGKRPSAPWKACPGRSWRSVSSSRRCSSPARSCRASWGSSSASLR